MLGKCFRPTSLIATVCLSLSIAIPANAALLSDPCGGTPTPCDDIFPSLGSFQIQVANAFKLLFAGYPGYNAGTGVLQSPVLFDPSTKVGRSSVFLDGSAGDTVGSPVGSAGTIVNDGMLIVPPGFNGGGAGAREVHTQIVTFALKDPSGTVQVRAGAAAPLRPNSLGEVQSQSNGGSPANDFPASSFFDVFVDVDLPAAGVFHGGTAHDNLALQILNNAVPNLPPKVIYIHGNSSGSGIFQYERSQWYAVFCRRSTRLADSGGPWGRLCGHRPSRRPMGGAGRHAIPDCHVPANANADSAGTGHDDDYVVRSGGADRG